MFSLKISLFLAGSLCMLSSLIAEAGELDVAAKSINSLGLDLLPRFAKPNENAVFSPYSIQAALTMAYAGAAGETKAEMDRLLRFQGDDAAAARSGVAFVRELAGICERSREAVQQSNDRGGPSEPITLETANRLYGQTGYAFRPAFLADLKGRNGASFLAVDFKENAEKVRADINCWVEQATRERIRDLIPAGGVGERTRLALVNAIYLKAAWANEFSKYATKPESFSIDTATEVRVPTMRTTRQYRYFRGPRFSSVAIPYVGDELQLLVVLPDRETSLKSVEQVLTHELLSECAKANPREISLWLPKFKVAPPSNDLGADLQHLGMKTAFDEPRGSANFDRMAPRKPDGYLAISKVFHKAFIEIDEKGTEAAAATAVAMSFALSVSGEPHRPIEFKVDRPFLFAIQHRASGACLFLGRVVDPRGN